MIASYIDYDLVLTSLDFTTLRTNNGCNEIIKIVAAITNVVILIVLL